MDQLGKILTVVHDAHDRVGTLAATYRDWVCPAPTNTLLVDRQDMTVGRVRWLGPGPFPRPIETRRSIWLCAPNRLRVERRRRIGALMVVAVRDGPDWWRWDAENGAVSGTSAAEVSDLPPMLDPPLLSPVRLLASLRLQPDGEGMRAGREVLRARAWPRERAHKRNHLSVELEFDAEHGTVLRRAQFEGGRCHQVTEAVRIEYGCDIHPEQFVFGAPDAQAPH